MGSYDKSSQNFSARHNKSNKHKIDAARLPGSARTPAASARAGRMGPARSAYLQRVHTIHGVFASQGTGDLRVRVPRCTHILGCGQPMRMPLAYDTGHINLDVWPWMRTRARGLGVREVLRPDCSSFHIPINFIFLIFFFEEKNIFWWVWEEIFRVENHMAFRFGPVQIFSSKSTNSSKD